MQKIWSVAVLTAGFFMTTLTQAAPVRLRCDYRDNPLGMDDVTPQFSWQSDSTEHNWRQSAYEILVASTPENLQGGSIDVWDSGKQSSSESVGIVYAGHPLESRKRYYWAVRVWDSNGQQTQSSESAWWEMGLLQKSDWAAKWITRTDPQEAVDRAGIRWIWAAGQNALQAAPKKTFVFHTTLKLKDKPRDAALFLMARGDFKAEVNGHQVGAKHEWHEFDREDVTNQLNRGDNSIDVTVTVAE